MRKPVTEAEMLRDPKKKAFSLFFLSLYGGVPFSMLLQKNTKKRRPFFFLFSFLTFLDLHLSELLLWMLCSRENTPKKHFFPTLRLISHPRVTPRVSNQLTPQEISYLPPETALPEKLMPTSSAAEDARAKAPPRVAAELNTTDESVMTHEELSSKERAPPCRAALFSEKKLFVKFAREDLSARIAPPAFKWKPSVKTADKHSFIF